MFTHQGYACGAWLSNSSYGCEPSVFAGRAQSLNICNLSRKSSDEWKGFLLILNLRRRKIPRTARNDIAGQPFTGLSNGN